MAKPSTMATHRYHSWGRTRGPKNLARPEQATQAATATAAPTAVTDGYATENQMYLHMFLDTSVNTGQANDFKVTVWGWNHAFGVWFEMKDTAGNVIELAANDTKAHRIFEIAGTDRVYFQASEALLDTNKFFAACSTI